MPINFTDHVGPMIGLEKKKKKRCDENTQNRKGSKSWLTGTLSVSPLLKLV